MDPNNMGGQTPPQNNMNMGGTPPQTPQANDDKLWAILAYVLFFLPLLKDNRSQFLTFHTNQGTILFILGFGGNIILSMIPILGWILLPILNIFVFILFILGVINASKMQMKKLPIIGGFEIIK
ncbi:MAG: hypothetical protein AAB840_01420 [Patescibacteria group bacterium]